MIITKKQIENGLLIFTVLAVFFNDFFNTLSSSGIFTLEYGTYLVVLLAYLSIFIFFRTKFLFRIHNVPKSIRVLYTIWITYLIISLVRGLFSANSYWEFKFLFLQATLFTLIASVFYVGQNLYFAQKILNFYLKKVFIFGFIFIPIALFTYRELYPHLMIPVGIFILFIPYVPKKWKIIIISVVLSSILVEISYRTNLIKLSLSTLILALYFFKNLINTFLVKVIWITFFITPLILLFLGLFGDYNIFQEMSKNEEYTTINAAGEEEDLSADTRTFLYVEVISDMMNSGFETMLIGKSPSQGYESFWFYGATGADNNIRFLAEVNILNIFLHYGLFGVLLFAFLLIKVSYTAITKSKNKLSKMLGLLIATRFMLSFIEEFTQYDLNFYFFWLVMGLVSSSKFRSMTDMDIKAWLQHGSKFLKTKVVN